MTDREKTACDALKDIVLGKKRSIVLKNCFLPDEDAESLIGLEIMHNDEPWGIITNVCGRDAIVAVDATLYPRELIEFDKGSMVSIKWRE